ncbi:hypothetical protein DXG03_000059 [Asterophora parasitica]|uniref:Uncharacterized protein n=1 Tax=Asterophora parasitica TaxID=117018 RepID=A0A9P7GKK3_9AGAR|nr:hypothetical protein DXG03_000059 [Asterophora parasitica]
MLKPPSPSTRNEGRPSQRALTQRKRDMKGCLAVWIVWACFMTYEGFVEGLISLFIPFYDEIKSLGLIFLILTRARGAEPIFLHVIRPFVKPHTQTIDMLLDLARMVGDITVAVLAVPLELGFTWWKSFIFCNEEVLDSEVESTRRRATPAAANSTEASLRRAVGDDRRGEQSVTFPKKDRRPPPNRRASGENDRRPSQTRPRDNVGQRVQENDDAPHQVWYPPPSSYYDDENPTVTISGLPGIENNTGFLSSEAMREREEYEEWRKYPPFPAAYPPTPLVTTANLPSTSTRQPLANSLVLSELLENEPQQDFSRSLLPPRKPLNPGFVDGLSDEFQSPGVPNDQLQSMSVDSDSDEDDDDEEDVFNTTLQTPAPPLRATRSGIIPAIPINREVSMASSKASRSTALTTAAGNASSLHTQSSLESLSSGAVSISDLSSVLGKKRPLPHDSIDLGRSRVGLAEAAVGRHRSGGNHVADEPTRRVQSKAASHLNRKTQPSDIDNDETASTSSSWDADLDNNLERKPAHPKRRKVIMSPGRPVSVARPPRPRISRYATAPKRAQTPRAPKPVAPSRAVPRSHLRSTAQHAGSAVSSDASQASLSSNNTKSTRVKQSTKAPVN